MLKDDRELESATFLFVFGKNEEPCIIHNITRRIVLETFVVKRIDILLFVHKQRRKETICRLHKNDNINIIF